MARTLLEVAARFAKSRLDASTSITGDYMRGVDAREGIKAVPRQPLFSEREISEAIVLTVERIDFVFSAEDLILGGVAIQPAQGDQWRFVRPDGMVAYYDVLPDEGGRCYATSDHLGILYRAFMTLNRVESPPEFA
jgi:hypothetical protein